MAIQVETITMPTPTQSIIQRLHDTINTEGAIRNALGSAQIFYYDGPLIQQKLQPLPKRRGQKQYYVVRNTHDYYSGFFLPDKNRRRQNQTMLFLGFHEEKGTPLFELRRVPVTKDPERVSTHRNRQLFVFPATEEELERLQTEELGPTIQAYLTMLIRGKRRPRTTSSDYFSTTATESLVPS